jgi:hypothetical protein
MFIVRIKMRLSGTGAKLLVLNLEVRIITTKLQNVRVSDRIDGLTPFVVI